MLPNGLMILDLLDVITLFLEIHYLVLQKLAIALKNRSLKLLPLDSKKMATSMGVMAMIGTMFGSPIHFVMESTSNGIIRQEYNGL